MRPSKITVYLSLLSVFFLSMGIVSCDDDSNNDTDTKAPLVPQNLEASADNHSITLTWLSNNEDDLWMYRIYKSTDLQVSPTLVDSTTMTTRTITNLINYKNYYFRLTAVDYSSNESDYSDSVVDMPRPIRIYITGTVLHSPLFPIGVEGIRIELAIDPICSLEDNSIESIEEIIFTDQNGQFEYETLLLSRCAESGEGYFSDAMASILFFYTDASGNTMSYQLSDTSIRLGEDQELQLVYLTQFE